MRIGIHAMKHPEIADELDAEKLAEVALGLLALTLHDGSRAWKGLDWGVMNLLYERGWILDPHGKTKSVVLTDTGLALAEKLLLKHFGRSSENA
jgi:hypothetical protein